MNRRTFIKLFTLTATGLGAAIRILGALPVRYVRAIKASHYPGRVKKLDPDEVRKQGPWAG